MKIEINIEVIINKLEDKVNEFTVRNHELAKLGAIKDRLEATYRCELRKELLNVSLNNIKISMGGGIARDNANIVIGNAKITQLKLNSDLAKIRYYSMKGSIENIKFEIEVLRSMLTWLSIEVQSLKLKMKGYTWLN